MGTHPIFESDFDCLTENDKFMNEAFELIDQLAQNDQEIALDQGWAQLEQIYSQMSTSNRTEIARKIIETSRANPALLDSCTERSSSGPLANEMLKTSFYYRDYGMARKLIESGASLQSVLLQSGEGDIRTIGTAIYQMHKYRTADDDVISFFLDNVIGSTTKLEIKRAIAGEAVLFNDHTCASSYACAIDRAKTTQIGQSRRAQSLKKRRRISIKDTLPDISELESNHPSTSSPSSSSTSSIDHRKLSTSRTLIEVLNKTNTITQSVTENIYLNLTNGNPLTSSDTVALVIGASCVGGMFGFLLGVSFTAIFTFIVVTLLRLI